MTTSTRKGWQSHGSHAHVQTAMLVIAVVDLNRIREERKRPMGRHAASRPGRLRPQHNTEDISLRNIEENTVPKREDRQSQGVGYRLLQLFAGMSIFLAIILVMHVGWVYIGNGMDQIHTQQTIVTNQGFKTAQPTKTDGSTRIAKPQTGEPPTEPEPEYSTVIGWMRIPRFGTEWQRAIQEGTDLKVLDNYGIGHYQGTVMPGSIGNSSYAGHRTPGDLRAGGHVETRDPIIIQTADHWYVYEMQSSWMTTPDRCRRHRRPDRPKRRAPHHTHHL